MILCNLLEKIDDNIMLSKAINRITDFLAFLKIRDVKTIKTEQLLKSLEEFGVYIDFEELIKIVKDFEIIEDINSEFITLSKEDTSQTNFHKDSSYKDKERLSKKVVGSAKKSLKKKFD